MADVRQKIDIDAKAKTSLDKNAIVLLLDIPIALVGGRSRRYCTANYGYC
jgi:hypothetical protein